MTENLFPVTHLSRTAKEKLLGQRACVLWLTGLSGSGKTTLAATLEQHLHASGYLTQILDGDTLRTGLCAGLTFSADDRTENVRRTAEVAKLFVEAGVIVICTLISPTRAGRALARSVVGVDDFYEVFVNAPLEVCEARDVKGLYAKALRGELSNFTGVSAPYEPPYLPDLEICTAETPLTACADALFTFAMEKCTQKP